MNFIYVVDPMCSWCYGFSKNMDALLAQPPGDEPAEVQLVMGGLRPYTTEPMASGRADEIFKHWHHVHEASGQPFTDAQHSAMHQSGFVYDTEPACRATVTVRTYWPAHAWAYLKAVQNAFYAEGRNVTRTEVLADLAEQLGMPRAEFTAAFESDEMREATREDFAQTQAWGIRGFPALVAEHGGQLHMVANGYTPIEPLRERLAALQAGQR